ncbi:hypothetical protein COV18_04005 [Candidatus Woesearchaeota archaeon CG10_big_fil_rev_8_21_14_0_10_37_12]|nr:MAG: hypothetical protein COV18_04005 [Candidatus Woesearchaeota archaeon CG10_big_fil_rev_8_21_14_0_10_37_12]
MSKESPLDGLVADFLPENVGTWAYKRPDGATLPYAKAVHYSRGQEGSSLTPEQLDERNNRAARSAQIIGDEQLLRANGLSVGLAAKLESADKGHTHLTFKPPVPMDDALSGEQPPITGQYPYVTFPAQGEVPYAIVVMYEEGEQFGTAQEIATIELDKDTWYLSASQLPEDTKHKKEIEQAVNIFRERGDRCLHPGTYKLNITVERSPAIAIRIDGYRPLTAQLLYDGPIRQEIPIGGLHEIISSSIAKYVSGIKIPNEMSPLEQKPPKQQTETPKPEKKLRPKYAEMSLVLPSDEPNKPFGMSQATLEYQGREDRADLIYVATRRTDSVGETDANPNFGLVEVQISQFSKVTNVDIDYKPKKIEEPEPRETTGTPLTGSFSSDRPRSFPLMGGGSYSGGNSYLGGGGYSGLRSAGGISGNMGTRGEDFGGGFDWDSLGSPSTSPPLVSTGRTKLGTPRTGSVSQK